jgi:hypothetical protein
MKDMESKDSKSFSYPAFGCPAEHPEELMPYVVYEFMRFLILPLLFFNFNLLAQDRTLTGKIISEDLETIPQANIQTLETTHIGTTDIDGNFEIKIPSGTE